MSENPPNWLNVLCLVALNACFLVAPCVILIPRRDFGTLSVIFIGWLLIMLPFSGLLVWMIADNVKLWMKKRKPKKNFEEQW